jgi:hypothetical protein
VSLSSWVLSWPSPTPNCATPVQGSRRRPQLVKRDLDGWRRGFVLAQLVGPQRHGQSGRLFTRPLSVSSRRLSKRPSSRCKASSLASLRLQSLRSSARRAGGRRGPWEGRRECWEIPPAPSEANLTAVACEFPGRSRGDAPRLARVGPRRCPCCEVRRSRGEPPGRLDHPPESGHHTSCSVD